MNLIYSYTKYPLQFAFDARTSRGAIHTHIAYLIQVSDGTKRGIGEASPLAGLSIDAVPEFEAHLQFCLNELAQGKPLKSLELESWPALHFGLETAIADFHNGGCQLFEPNNWVKGVPIPINGLVWMNQIDQMFEQAIAKAQQGYSHIKFKVGALDFEQECSMLSQFRKQYDASKVHIRLDANGAFSISDAVTKLEALSHFQIHSIEQPIPKGNWDAMATIVQESAIPIALDEELIGIDVWSEGNTLMKSCMPDYLILKPTLIGGITNANEWIRLAHHYNKGWWATSALESNIGLNRIAQWCSSTCTTIPQGLGTGSLYTNNFESPFTAAAGLLTFDSAKTWQLPF
jgi:O-succinylbenzoate synthase